MTTRQIVLFGAPAGALFGANHVTPTGPLGLGCFVAAAVLLHRKG